MAPMLYPLSYGVSWQILNYIYILYIYIYIYIYLDFESYVKLKNVFFELYYQIISYYRIMQLSMILREINVMPPPA